VTHWDDSRPERQVTGVRMVLRISCRRASRLGCGPSPTARSWLTAAAEMFVQRLLSGMAVEPPHSEGYLRLFARYAMGDPGKDGVGDSRQARNANDFHEPGAIRWPSLGRHPRRCGSSGRSGHRMVTSWTRRRGAVIIPAQSMAQERDEIGESPSVEEENSALGTGEDRLELVVRDF